MLTAYTDHVKRLVQPCIDEFRKVWNANRVACETVWRAAERHLYREGMPFIALSYDALRAEVDDDELNELRIARCVPW